MSALLKTLTGTKPELVNKLNPPTVVWMDNEVGYQCELCSKVFGPWDFGWPPVCDCVDLADISGKVALGWKYVANDPCWVATAFPENKWEPEVDDCKRLNDFPPNSMFSQVAIPEGTEWAIGWFAEGVDKVDFTTTDEPNIRIIKIQIEGSIRGLEWLTGYIIVQALRGIPSGQRLSSDIDHVIKM